MKRSEMIEDIASELVHEHTGFISWDKAQELAETVLTRIEDSGMKPPNWLSIKNNDKPLKERTKIIYGKWEKE